MALVRGTVADVNGTGLADVKIEAANHPEFGQTLSLANGEYFFVVNGGGPLTIRASKTGLLRSDRLVNPVWGAVDFAQPIVLVALDSTKTAITFAQAGGSAASGSDVTESGVGTRKASIFFPSGVQVTTNSGGVPSATFRVTEFTVGANGQDRMPANVAANTMYTYAAEFSLEDAGGSLYDSVTFSTPVMVHLTNFLGMSVGESVPVGYYDRQAGNWKPMPSGRVISIDATTGAVSGLQTGDPIVSSDELAKLATYKGKTIWRLPLTHFSPLDFNLGLGAPACETQNGSVVCPAPVTSQATGGDDGPACGSCEKSGSIIDVERQVLRETFPVVGTPYSLNYSSENTLGYAWNKTLNINFENFPKHSKLKQFVLNLDVAGKRAVEGGIFPDGNGNYSNYAATWDGRDQDGRVVQGATTATLNIGSVYQAERRNVASFGAPGSGPVVVMPPSLTGTRQDPNFTIWTRQVKQLQVWDASALGFGGWSIDAHHTFDPTGNVVYLGDGTHYKVAPGSGAVEKIAGITVSGNPTSPDGTLANAAYLSGLDGLAVDRTGDVYLALADQNVVRVIRSDGKIYDFAGKSNQPTTGTWAGEGQPAVGAYLDSPSSIAVETNGNLLIADSGSSNRTGVYRILRVDSQSRLRTVAGHAGGGLSSTNPNCGLFADGADATTVDLCGPRRVVAGPDGSVYFMDIANNGQFNPPGYYYPVTQGYIARVDPAGKIFHVAGGGSLPAYGSLPAGTMGPELFLDVADPIAVTQSGSLIIATQSRSPINSWSYFLEIPSGGDVRAFPQQSVEFQLDANLQAQPDGSFVLDTYPPNEVSAGARAIQKCSLLGSCTPLVGKANPVVADFPNPIVGWPATATSMGWTNAIASAPDGATYWQRNLSNADGTHGDYVYRTSPPLRLNASSTCAGYSVPSKNGAETYCFDAAGRHQSTANTLTNGTIRRFGYCDGLLCKIVEADGRETVVDRATSGVVKITSPTSQATQITLDSSKQLYATSISGNGTIRPTHDLNNGLLTALTDVNSQPHSFTYDNFGRLQKDTDPAGGYQYLTRTETPTGKYTVAVTTAMGKTDSFAREILSDGREQRTFGLLSGLFDTTTLDGGGASTTTLADGTVLLKTLGADPRWGTLAPFVASTKFTAGSYSASTATTRTLASDGSGSVTDVTTLNGDSTKTYQKVYSGSAKTLALTTPLGRTVTYTLDAQGRVQSVQRPGVPRIDFTINASTGRIDQVKQGTGRIVDLTYSTTGTNKGFLTSLSDPHDSAAPLVTTFAPDANGRPLSSTRQSVVTALDWTPSGLLKTLTPPDKPAHQLLYDARGLLKTYAPPTLGGSDEKTTFNLDLDRYLQSVDAPGPDDLTIQTDPIKGRVTSMLVGGQSISFGYYPASSDPSCTAGCGAGHLASIVDNRSATTTTFKWTNSLPLSIDEAGGTTSWTYNSDIRTSDETFVKGGHNSKVSFGYDLDGLLTCASFGTCAAAQPERVDIVRDTAGRPYTATFGGALNENYRYNTFGELRYQDTHALHIEYQDGNGPDDAVYPRDAQGRVKHKYDQMDGVAKVYTYEYDEQGRLRTVGGPSVWSEYRYDNNGNRTYARNTAGVLDGRDNGEIVYDAQDRLLKYGTTTFDYTLKGDIFHRYAPEGTTTYQYDALGALRSVRLADGRLLEYLVDGLGRRIGKKVNGTLIKQWYYGSGMAPIAEADGAGVVKMRFAYGRRGNVPDLVKTYSVPEVADGTYHISTDQLGTPRVIQSASGTIVETTDFDEFGIKLTDTCSDFVFPFGFAGGLYDPDTKLTRFGARDYDASIGRWVSKDPILFGGGQANLYVYVNNDPINLQDPSGLGYTDINFTSFLGVGWGITFGIFWSDTACGSGSRFHPYLGAGLVTPGATLSISRGTGAPSPGLWSWQAAGAFLSPELMGGAAAIGSDATGKSTFKEAGVAFGAPPGPGVSLTGYYTW